MIKMTLPGFSEFPDVNWTFLDLMRGCPGLFCDDVAVESVYGGVPGSGLCGGRNSAGPRPPLDSMKWLIGRYNELGVGCNVTYSNFYATGKMLEESPYDQAVLALLNAGQGNGVIVYSDDLAQALRREYPNLTLIASTTKSLGEKQAIDVACRLYDRVVVDYGHTLDEQLLGSVGDPGKIELMVNEYCTPNCPYRHEHYRAISRAQLEGTDAQFACRHAPAPQAYGFLQGLVEGGAFLRNGDIRHLHDSFGVGHFKVVGRGLSRFDVTDSYLYYLVRLDSWNEVRGILVEGGVF